MFEADNKENPIVKGILDNLSSAIDTLKNEIANIEESYKKKLEVAKAHLAACLEETEKQYEYWSNLGEGNMPVAAPKKRRSRKTAVETILESEPIEEKEDVVIDEEAAVAEEKLVDDLPFAEEEAVIDTEAVAESEEVKVDAADDWEENTEAEAQEDKSDDNDGWGDFPAEWK